MKYTNINIDSPTGQMKYYLEYIPGVESITEETAYRFADNKTINFYDPRTNVIRKGNEWIKSSISDVIYNGFLVGYTQLPGVVGVVTPTTEEGFFVGYTELPGKLGNNYNISTHIISYLNLYFPRFSVETYEKGVKYAINISTWIHGVELILGSYLIDRNDVIASENIRRFANEEYYEYLNIPIIDPWYVTYNSKWRRFREDICGEPMDGNHEMNSTGSILNITIHPVRLTSDNTYTEIENYHGGQNSINISDETHDYLEFNIGDNRDINNYYENRLLVGTELVFNSEYSQDKDGLCEYLKETYRLDDYSLKLEIVVQDDSDVYSYMLMDIDDPWREFDVRTLVDENGNHPLLFDSWDGYKEGMYINMFLHIIPSGSEDSLIYLKSNKILLTPEFFRYLVGKPDDINKIFLEVVDMNIYNINAVNKVSQNIIQMERPDDYKANIIKPVFFKTHNLSNLVIYPGVTQNICINLDSYKSKVNAFILKIEGVSFTEYGRNNSGVIFRIIGNNLPGSVESGTYYILNQDNELITTGKYKYES